MKDALSLFGNLVLTFMAFVVPLLTAFLSIFQKGLASLRVEYEYEQSQTEQNIKTQLQKINSDEKDFPEKEIQDNLIQLRKFKKKAEKKLSTLDPKYQILRTFIPLAISFLMIEIALIINDYQIISGLFMVSIVFFTYSLWNLWKQINILIEVKKIIDEEETNKNVEANQALISALKALENGRATFLKKVMLRVNGSIVTKDEPEINLPVDAKASLKLMAQNAEDRMAKNVQIGIVFPKDFIIEQGNKYTIARNEGFQFVRENIALIHGHTRLALNDLEITPLKKGTVIIKTFIKAENIEVKYNSFKIKVI